MDFDVIIIGAGASGMICARKAAGRGKKVCLLEHNPNVGNKIRISGGGRCNFTNLSLKADNFISGNPHFVKSAISGFTPNDFITILEKHHIPYSEKVDGQLFCNKSAMDIVNMLRNDCENRGVTFFTNTIIDAINRDSSFIVKTNREKTKAAKLVIATGGLSYPELGATDFGLQMARRFGVKVTELRPALVPLVFSSSDQRIFSKLAGISFRGKISLGTISFTDDILFTHRGLSGPATLQISSHWKKGNALTIDLLPDIDIAKTITKAKNTDGKKLFKTFLRNYLSSKLADTITESERLVMNVADLSDKDIKRIANVVHNWEITPAGTEGYAKAEATRGGVDTSELSSKTMESKKIPGLYFVGEVIDVVGQLGGYNLHWAWASGYAAGKSV